MQALHAEDKIRMPCQSIELGSVHAKVYRKAGPAGYSHSPGPIALLPHVCGEHAARNPNGARWPPSKGGDRQGGRFARRLLMSLRRALIAAGLGLVSLVSQAWAAPTEIQLWHAMPGELGRQLERIVANFNASQTKYRIIPVFKGSYAETINAAIFAMRTRTHPAIVQVSEIGTATMMAAKGAIYPISELMQDAGEMLDAQPFLPAVAGYYADVSGNLL